MVENRDPISKALTSQLAHENNEASMFAILEQFERTPNEAT